MAKRIGIKTKFRGRIFEIADARVRHDNGREFSYEVMKGRGGSEGSMIVALDSKGRVVLVNEYFAGIDKYQLCLPKGRIGKGERPESTARRELEEETGFRASKLRLLAKFYLSPGYSDQKTFLFLATGLTRPKNPLKGDEMEPMKVRLVPLSKAVELAKKGIIMEARAVAGLLIARDYVGGRLKGKKPKD